MTKSEQNVSKAPDGTGDVSVLARQSFDAMSGTFSAWLRDANRFQAEAIRFLNDRFNKDIQMMSQFTACRKPEEFFDLQAKLMSGLVSDYMAEGTRVLELFGDVAKTEMEDFSRISSARHSG